MVIIIITSALLPLQLHLYSLNFNDFLRLCVGDDHGDDGLMAITVGKDGLIDLRFSSFSSLFLAAHHTHDDNDTTTSVSTGRQ